MAKVTTKEAYEWKQCTRCDLNACRKGVILGRYPGLSLLDTKTKALARHRFGRIMIVSLRPSEHEDKKMKGMEGDVRIALEHFSAKAGLRLYEVFYTHIVACITPQNREPNREEIKQCKDRVLQEIFLVEPELIIAFGTKVLKALTSRSRLDIKKVRGEIFDTTFEYGGHEAVVPVMAVLDPMKVLHAPDGGESGNFTHTVMDLRQAQLIVDAMGHMRETHGS